MVWCGSYLPNRYVKGYHLKPADVDVGLKLKTSDICCVNIYNENFETAFINGHCIFFVLCIKMHLHVYLVNCCQ